MTTTRSLQGFAFLCKLGLFFFKLAGITKFKYERKNEKDSGRSSKMTPSCKRPIVYCLIAEYGASAQAPLIDSVFAGRLVSIVICRQCHKVSYQIFCFNVRQLPVLVIPFQMNGLKKLVDSAAKVLK